MTTSLSNFLYVILMPQIAARNASEGIWESIDNIKIWDSIDNKQSLELYRQERKVWDSIENTKKFGESILVDNNANCDSIDNKKK